MRHAFTALVALGLSTFGSGAAWAQQCLGPIMNPSGASVSSPFGVDRTGRASNGYHLGLDLVNNQGLGAPILAGVNGTVALSRADATNSVFVLSADGKQRFGYLHGKSRNVATGDTVSASDQVIAMGSKGAGSAVHLHLYTSLRGDVMASLGASAGRVWPLSSGDFWGNKHSGGLAGSDISSVSPATFYMVNPETFLDHRIAFPSYLSAAYGVSRPGGLTLTPTCLPSTETFDRGTLMSENGGVSGDGGLTEEGEALSANEQSQVNVASQEGRDAAMLYSRSAVGALVRAKNRGRGDDVKASVWAGMVLATERW
tara:strand:+ start:5426 stop:6367 length:942 start_codon:yes stop_codon:yes gene_type:complete